jgi:hypothetical protein
VYDNITGCPKQIATGGIQGNANSSMKVDVLVNGPSFTFYLNDKFVGKAFDEQYSTGTVGVAVDAGGSIIASNFALFATT